MRERDIHAELVRRVKALGGEVRRVKWQGRAHAPDVLVMLPGRHFYAEEKRPGVEVVGGQAREAERMRRAAMVVYAINSFEDIERVLTC